MDLLSVSSGMDPSHVCRSLLRVASVIDDSASPDARRVSASLARIAEAAEKEEPAKVVVLHGPFRKAKPGEASSGRGMEEGEVEEGFVVQNDEFLAMAAEAMGPNITLADFGDGYHHFVVEASFYTDASDPSVGWHGGTELEEWSLVALDGVVLENEEDRRAVEAELKRTVDALKDGWAEDHARSEAEYAAEARAEARAEAEYDY